MTHRHTFFSLRKLQSADFYSSISSFIFIKIIFSFRFTFSCMYSCWCQISSPNLIVLCFVYEYNSVYLSVPLYNFDSTWIKIFGLSNLVAGTSPKMYTENYIHIIIITPIKINPKFSIQVERASLGFININVYPYAFYTSAFIVYTVKYKKCMNCF